jgi:2-keto-3-deoxy-galactonokinase
MSARKSGWIFARSPVESVPAEASDIAHAAKRAGAKRRIHRFMCGASFIVVSFVDYRG